MVGHFSRVDFKFNDNSRRALSTHAHSAYSAHGVSSGGSVDGGGGSSGGGGGGCRGGCSGGIIVARKQALPPATMAALLPPPRRSTARQLRFKLPPCLPLCGQSPLPLPAAYATVQLPSDRESWRLCRHRHPADSTEVVIKYRPQIMGDFCLYSPFYLL